MGEGLELRPVQLAVQAGPRATRVVERDLARPVERPGRGHADECTLERAPAERAPDDLVLAGSEDQRQRRRPLAQVDAGDLPRLDRLAGAIEDVVGDLKGDPQGKPERSEVGPTLARAEQAR